MLQAISPFLTMFSTAIYLECVKMWYCVVMGFVIIDQYQINNITAAGAPIHNFLSLFYQYPTTTMFSHERGMNHVQVTVIIAWEEFSQTWKSNN